MGLKEGTLESLIESGRCPNIANTVFQQMLQALDCLAFNGIIHRDVKPENILYTLRLGDQYQFQLGDFGLCNRALSANTSVGSPLYMAPEMFKKGGQTHKVDVWSLFVTMLWTLDVRRFRQSWKLFKFPSEAHKAVLFTASNDDTISKIREMAIFDPEKRASAVQMLIKCYNGVGLSSPRHRVPGLITSPAISAARAPTPAPPVPTTRTAQPKPKLLQKNTNVFAAAGQHRVEKARFPLQAQPPRQPFSPVPKKRLGRALDPVTAEKLRIPGTMLGININPRTEARKQPKESVYFT